MRVEPPCMQQSAPFHETPESSLVLSATWGHSDRCPSATGRRALTDSESVGARVLDFQPPELWETNVCCLRPLVCGAMWQQPGPTEAVITSLQGPSVWSSSLVFPWPFWPWCFGTLENKFFVESPSTWVSSIFLPLTEVLQKRCCVLLPSPQATRNFSFSRTANIPFHHSVKVVPPSFCAKMTSSAFVINQCFVGHCLPTI